MKNQTKVNQKTANAIQELEKLLIEQFGADFSYSIAGNGHVIAASNLRQGTIAPEVDEKPFRVVVGLGNGQTHTEYCRDGASANAYYEEALFLGHSATLIEPQ